MKKVFSLIVAVSMFLTTTFSISSVANTKTVSDLSNLVTKFLIKADFENGSTDPFQHAGCSIHTITTDSKNGNGALKSQKINDAETQNRIQSKYDIQRDTQYNINFWAKGEDRDTNVTGLIYVYDSNDEYLATLQGFGFTLQGSEWQEINANFELTIQDGALKTKFTRPDGSGYSSWYTLLDSVNLKGADIGKVNILFYSPADIWYVDDYFISYQADPSTIIVPYTQNVVNSNFENGTKEPWSGITYSNHTIVDNEARTGEYSLKSVRTSADEAGQNRVQTNFTRGTGQGYMALDQTYDINFSIKSDGIEKPLYIVMVAYNALEESTSIQISAGAVSLKSDEWLDVSCKIRWSVDENNDLYAFWTTPLGESTSAKRDLAMVNGETVTRFAFFVYTETETFYIDDISISADINVSYPAFQTMEQIKSIGKVTSLDQLSAIETAEASYAKLSAAQKMQVFNYDILKEARQTYRILNGEQKEKNFNENQIVLTFGAISDTHIGGKYFADANQRFSNALRILQEKAKNQMDALVISGDITDTYSQHSNADSSEEAKQEIHMFKSLVENNLAKGTDVFYSLGNHDSQDLKMWSNGPQGKVFYNILKDSDYFFKNDIGTTEEIYNGNRHFIKNGYHFLAVESCYYNTAGKYTEDTRQWLQQTLNEIVSDASYHGETIFVVSHMAATNTVYGSNTIAGGGYGIKDILSQYPQVLFFSGHTHYGLSDERNIWQGDFTAVNLACTYYGGLIEDTSFIENDENGEVENLAEMSQGTLVEVDNQGNTRITRLDFYRDGKQIKESWIVPAPETDKSHLLHYTGDRGTVLNKNPVFANNANISVQKITPTRILLTFDTATDNDVVEHYKIDLYKKDSVKVSKTYKSLTPFYLYPDLKDLPTKKKLVLDGLNENNYTIKITAVDSWGKQSEPISITVDETTPMIETPTLPEVEKPNVTKDDFTKVFTEVKDYKDGKYGVELTVLPDQRLTFKSQIPLDGLHIVLSNIQTTTDGILEFCLGGYGHIFGEGAQGVYGVIKGGSSLTLMLRKASVTSDIILATSDINNYFSIPEVLDIHFAKEGDFYNISINGIILKASAKLLEANLTNGMGYLNFGGHNGPDSMSYTINTIETIKKPVDDKDDPEVDDDKNDPEVDDDKKNPEVDDDKKNPEVDDDKDDHKTDQEKGPQTGTGFNYIVVLFLLLSGGVFLLTSKRSKKHHGVL